VLGRVKWGGAAVLLMLGGALLFEGGAVREDGFVDESGTHRGTSPNEVWAAAALGALLALPALRFFNPCASGLFAAVVDGVARSFITSPFLARCAPRCFLLDVLPLAPTDGSGAIWKAARLSEQSRTADGWRGLVPRRHTRHALTVHQELIERLGLAPHPEGGFYRETYRASTTVDVDGRVRSASTAIYFLLRAGDVSTLHQITSDEVWHFYAGSDLEVVALAEGGVLERHRLGQDPSTGATLQCVVPAGQWFGARLCQPVSADAFALVGCTVAPGFDFADFTLGQRAALLQKFPQHAELIVTLTRGADDTVDGVHAAAAARR
jgi:predicted cupin superfamily sugar epimerase